MTGFERCVSHRLMVRSGQTWLGVAIHVPAQMAPEPLEMVAAQASKMSPGKWHLQVSQEHCFLPLATCHVPFALPSGSSLGLRRGDLPLERLGAFQEQLTQLT